MKPSYLIILLVMNFFFWAGVYSAYQIMGPNLLTGGIVTLRFGLAGLCLLAGFALGLCGVVPLNGVWRKDFRWTGMLPSLIFVSSFVCEAAGSVIGKPIVARASVMKMLALALLAGTAVNLLIDGPATLRSELAVGRRSVRSPGRCAIAPVRVGNGA